jgi:DNA-binding NarL/FixJ family response regulator
MMQKASLLLVDDHAVVRAGIRNAIESLPEIEILGELGDGKALFQCLEELQPDFLLLDVNMPDFDPIVDVGKIRLAYPQMKILVISAYDDDVYVQGLLGLGVDGYHLKDQALSDLRLAVQRILAGEKWVSSRLVERLVLYNERSQSDYQLTQRQRDMLRLLHKGLDNRNIALELGLSIKTVENHLTRLYKQINVRSRLEAMNYIMQHPEILASTGSLSQITPIPLQRSPNRRSILLVDDNARYRQQLMKMLATINQQALLYEAESIERAILFVQKTQPVLALVDVVLGDENGLLCVRQIRKHSPKTRILLFSAYPDSEFHRLGLEAGAIAFLDKKNIDSATLRQILADVNLA